MLDYKIRMGCKSINKRINGNCCRKKMHYKLKVRITSLILVTIIVACIVIFLLQRIPLFITFHQDNRHFYEVKPGVIPYWPDVIPGGFLNTNRETYDSGCGVINKPTKGRYGWFPPPILKQANSTQATNLVTADVMLDFKVGKLNLPLGSFIREFFSPRMTANERANLLEIMDDIHKLSLTTNLTYFLAAGTLIGAVRHQGTIPWDDDFDIIVKWSDRFIIHDYFSSNEKYGIKTGSELTETWKIYQMKSEKVDPYCFSWRWPFVDVFFYTETGNNLKISETSPALYWLKDHVFPLKKLKFENRLYFVPKDWKYVLSSYGYDIKNCMSTAYCHRYEYTLKHLCSLKCEYLYFEFPFLFWTHEKYKDIATLKKDQTVLDEQIYLN